MLNNQLASITYIIQFTSHINTTLQLAFDGLADRYMCSRVVADLMNHGSRGADDASHLVVWHHKRENGVPSGNKSTPHTHDEHSLI